MAVSVKAQLEEARSKMHFEFQSLLNFGVFTDSTTYVSPVQNLQSEMFLHV